MLLKKQSRQPRQIEAGLPRPVLGIEHNQFHRQISKPFVGNVLTIILVLEANDSVFPLLRSLFLFLGPNQQFASKSREIEPGLHGSTTIVLLEELLSEHVPFSNDSERSLLGSSSSLVFDVISAERPLLNDLDSLDSEAPPPVDNSLLLVNQ